jgi:hypothetical protein
VALDFGSLAVIVLLVAIPLALFLLLFNYLRRTAPGGEVTPQAPQATPAPSGPLEGSKTCTRCGFVVKAHKLRLGTQCPNCGSGLPG